MQTQKVDGVDEFCQFVNYTKPKGDIPVKKIQIWQNSNSSDFTMAMYSIALTLIVLAVAGSGAGIHAALTSPNTKFQVVEGSDLADLGLRKVPQVTADKHGAKCIDGSVPAYYISKLNTSSTQWVRKRTLGAVFATCVGSNTVTFACSYMCTVGCLL